MQTARVDARNLSDASRGLRVLRIDKSYRLLERGSFDIFVALDKCLYGHAVA